MRWLFLCLALVGCGDDAMFGGKKDKGGGGGDELAPASDPATPRPQYFATAAAMPACTAENQDWLVYVADEKKLKACLAGAWTDVETAAPAAVEPTRITSSIHCGGPLEGTPIWFSYSVAQLNSGDVFAEGSVRDGYWQVGSSNFYAATQNGAVTASVLFQYDLQGMATAGFWTLSLDRATLITTIDYQDAEGPMAWTMTPDACQVQEY